MEEKARIIVGEKIIKLTEKYPDKKWRWYRLSNNPNITMDIIEKYPDKPWVWDIISENPNITIEFIENNYYRLDFDSLYKFEQDYKNELDKLYILQLKETFKTVLNEFMEVCLMPDNMKTMKGLGVYSDISW